MRRLQRGPGCGHLEFPLQVPRSGWQPTTGPVALEREEVNHIAAVPQLVMR